MPKDYKADIKPKLSNRQGLKYGNHNYKSHYHVRYYVTTLSLKTFYIATHQLVPRSSISIYLAAGSRAFRVLAQVRLKI